MKNVFGIMLTMSLMLFASVVFADHAPPNQTVEVSILNNIEVSPVTGIEMNTPELTNTVGILEAISFVQINQTEQTTIDVDSGQGYKRCLTTVNIKAINSGGLYAEKEGGCRIRRLS